VEMRATIESLGRMPMQRDTLYRPASPERQRAAIGAARLRAVVQTSPSDPRALANAIR
jgi:FO synthase